MRVDVDAIDLAADRDARRELVVLERHLELPRDECRARCSLGPHELLEVALQPLPELAALQVVGVDPQARVERAGNAAVHVLDRRLDVARRHTLGARNLRRQLLVEALQRDVSDRAPHHRVDCLVDPAGPEVALDEPGRGAAGHSLEIGDPERLPAREQRHARGDGGSPSGARTPASRVRACAASRSQRRARRPRADRSPRASRARAAAPAPSEPTRSARSGARAAASSCGGGRRPGRRARTPPPRTGSPRAASRRRLPPRGRARAASADACTRCRRDSDRGLPRRVAAGARPARCRARGASRRRRTETWARGAAAIPARGRSRTPPRSFASARAPGRARRRDPARRPHRPGPSPGRAPRGRRPRGP